MNRKATKGFDAVAEARKWRESLHEQVEVMSRKKRVQYFNRYASMNILINKPKK